MTPSKILARRAFLAAALVAAGAVPAVPAADPFPEAGQLLLVGFRGLGLADAEEVEALVCGLRVGGVVLYARDLPSGGGSRNVLTPDQLAALTRGLQDMAARCGAPPLLIAADEEGGQVRRLKRAFGFPPLPSAAELGRSGPEATARAADEAGRMLRAAGVDWDLAPVVDLALSLAGPAVAGSERAFSADPSSVTAHARAFIQGLRRHGVLNCIKHFPGLGSAAEDPHDAFVDVTETHREAELEPFRALVKEGLADCVMAAHIRHASIDPERAVTFSSAALTGLLRGELGFDGVILTDDLQMAAAVLRRPLEETVAAAAAAGADMLMIANNRDRYEPDAPARAAAALRRAVAEGRLAPERLRSSLQRIRRLKSRLGGAAGADQPR